MYELIQLTDRCYYIQSPAKMGLVRLDDERVCLIDSGNDKDAGRKVRQLLDGRGWRLDAIYNTHSNADHIGGNQYLQKQTGCRVYAPGIECDFTRHPLLEPSFLYGGYPCRDLRHKFLLAQPSDALPLTAEALPEGMTAIDLPGHFFDMVGFRTADGVVYLADCLSSRETLDKYKIMEGAMFVPAHAPAAESVAELAQYNIDAVLAVAEAIVDLCAEPVCFEQLLGQLFRRYGLTMNFEQYALVGSTVRSYLSWLKDAGRLDAAFDDSMLLWRRA